MTHTFDALLDAREDLRLVLATLLRRRDFRESLSERIPRVALGAPYARLTLAQRQDAEVALIHWDDSLGSAPHDHGDAWGVVALLKGRFVERRYTEVRGALRLLAAATYDAPTLLTCPRGLIHDLHAKTPGVSLHVYHGSALRNRVFDVDRRRTLTVPAETLAYLPRAYEVATTSQEWPKGDVR